MRRAAPAMLGSGRKASRAGIPTRRAPPNASGHATRRRSASHQSLCTRCGKAPAASGRASCEPCLATRREADLASYAAGKAAGLLYGGANVDAKRRSARAPTQRATRPKYRSREMGALAFGLDNRRCEHPAVGVPGSPDNRKLRDAHPTDQQAQRCRHHAVYRSREHDARSVGDLRCGAHAGRGLRAVGRSHLNRRRRRRLRHRLGHTSRCVGE